MSQFDNMTFVINDKCPKCKRNSFAEEIIDGWEKSYHCYTTKCPIKGCKKIFVAKLKVVKYENFDKK